MQSSPRSRSTFDFGDVIRLINYSSSSSIEQDPYSQIGNILRYRGRHNLRGRTFPFEVVYLQADATNDEVERALASVRDREDAELVYAPSLQVDGRKFDTERVTLHSTPSYLGSFIREELEEYLRRIKAEQPDIFVEPNIIVPSGFTRKHPNPIWSYLTDAELWAGNAEGTPALVLAEAGQGKTYMCRYLAARMALADDRNQGIPLYVNSQTWKALRSSEQVSLAKTMMSCLAYYGCAVPWLNDHEEEFIRLGLRLRLFTIIFDGFDEYLSGTSGDASETDIIDSINALATETSARIVVTSRTSFWRGSFPSRGEGHSEEGFRWLEYEMAPFEATHAHSYFSKLFGSDTERIDSANQLFRSLATSAPLLVGRGFVLNLIADVVRRGGAKNYFKEGQGTNALTWLVRELCTRDVLRQELPFDAGDQVRIFSQFAAEVAAGEKPSDETLEYCIGEVCPSLDEGDRRNVLGRLAPHPVLKKETPADRWVFVEDQVRLHLLADSVVRGTHGHLVQKWSIEGADLQDLVQAVVDVVRAKFLPTDVQKDLMRQILPRLPEEVRGLLLVAAVELFSRQGENRADRTRILCELSDGKLQSVHFSGSLTSFDFRGMVLTECRFSRVNFVNCEFDEDSGFADCRFLNDNWSTRSETIGKAQFERCTFDAASQRWIDQARVKAGKRAYTEKDLSRDLGVVLSRFIHSGRPALKNINSTLLRRGAIRGSKHADAILEHVEAKLLHKERRHGTGDPVLKVKQGCEADFLFYSQNGTFTGAVRQVYDDLKSQLVQ